MTKLAVKRKIHLTTEALNHLVQIAAHASISGDKDADQIGDEIACELARLKLKEEVRKDLETGKGYYAKRPEEAEKILAGDKDCHFTQATFDWIIDEMEWHLIEWRNENLTTNNQH